MREILEWLVLLPLWRRLIPNRMWHAPAVLGTGIAWIALISVIASSGGGNDSPGSPGNALPSEPSQQTGFDKAALPSYDGADLAGFARYTAENESGNCSSSYIDRVRRFASDTFTYQPVVFPEDTEEFISLLESACATEGHPIR